MSFLARISSILYPLSRRTGADYTQAVSSQVGIIIAYLLLCSTLACGGSKNQSQLSDRFDLKTATSPTRVFATAELTRVGVIPNNPSVLLSRPEIIRTDSSGNVLVLDYGDHIPKRFDVNGNLINTYGRGRGRGPGEFGSLVDMRTTPDNTVAMLELNERRLSFFDIEGELLQTKLLQRGFATRFLQTVHGRSYFLNISGDSVLTGIYEGNSTGFGQLFASNVDELEEVFLREGYIDLVGEDIVYVPMRTPVVLRYASDGSQVFASATPDLPTYNPPEIEELSIAGGRGSRPRGQPMNRLVSIDNGNIFVQSFIERSTMDVYNADTGTYKYSFEIPPGGPGRYISGGRYIHQEQDTLVVVYDLRLPDES